LDDFRDLDGERDRDCEPDLEEPELESDDDDEDDVELRELGELELLLLEVERLRRLRDLNLKHSCSTGHNSPSGSTEIKDTHMNWTHVT
jgi:hypothetical protein